MRARRGANFANRGRDVIKQDFDDVLKPQRQRELDALSARLASWKPDRIAVEWPFSFTDSARVWYERNFNMAHNLTRMLDPGVKRILVIVGSTRVPPLRNILDEAPQFCPVSSLPLLR